MADPLKLRARDDADLQAIATIVQDALVARGDIKYLPRERRFALMLNRFRWEEAPSSAVTPQPAQQDGDASFRDDGAAFERTHAVLSFEDTPDRLFSTARHERAWMDPDDTRVLDDVVRFIGQKVAAVIAPTMSLRMTFLPRR